jgi:ribonuclease HII
MRKRKLSQKYIIGIDEVGRGSLAGPVTVAAVLLPAKFKIKNFKLKMPLRDSKKLTSQQREIWFSYIKKSLLSYRIASVSPKIIDKINVSQAANLAATKALQALTIDNKQLTFNNYKIYLDGGLYLNKVNCKLSNVKCIIRGDEKIPAISLASIVAKVHRDKLMKRLHKKYPRYNFINNVGYGTKKHIKALRKFGYSSIHRKTFRCVI